MSKPESEHTATLLDKLVEPKLPDCDVCGNHGIVMYGTPDNVDDCPQCNTPFVHSMHGYAMEWKQRADTLLAALRAGGEEQKANTPTLLDVQARIDAGDIEGARQTFNAGVRFVPAAYLKLHAELAEARERAIEEAAKVCDAANELIRPMVDDGAYYAGAYHANAKSAAAIRALSGREGDDDG